MAQEQRNKVVSKLHAILKPFMLRRLKSDVNIALPQKAEVLLYSHMTKHQRELNQQVLDGTLKVRKEGRLLPFGPPEGSTIPGTPRTCSYDRNEWSSKE